MKSFRVFRIDPALDRKTAQLESRWVTRVLLTRCGSSPAPGQSRDFFGDCMLDLNAGIHFEK
jgi:hypothetical protein